MSEVMIDLHKVIERHELPVVVINLLTKNRTSMAIRTIQQCMRNFSYDGELQWFITDNASEAGHMDALLRSIPSNHLAGYLSSYENIGTCWNKGLRQIIREQESFFYVRLEDDMSLKVPMNITRYVKMMMEFPVIGMIRLGQITVGLDLFSEKFRINTHIGFEEDVLLRVGKTQPYCFSGHPALIHKRFHDAYGYYAETDMSAGELEVAMDHVVRNTEGPQVFIPWDLGWTGTWGAWDHIGTEKA